MENSLKSSFLIVSLVFLVSFGIVLFFVFLAGVLSFKVALYLFIATLISSTFTVTILGGLFTQLSSHLVHMRRLLRLDNLNHPLLLRLSAEAPGTYHHSILVSNLSSKAAKAIGADALLCRISSYFHDIGKLKNPNFFIENQVSSKNKEEEKSSSKNAQKIIEHAKEGIKMAEEVHLPKEIVDLIAQHHGTSFCGYYYQRAKEQNPTQTRRGDFRYPGPKPQTKEATILMLADSIEARTRARNDLSDLKKIVEEDIFEKIQEKQFSESGLSQREIFKLKQSFIESLESMLHHRIEYPAA